ncbi:hypothetical protein [Bacillus alkalicellulosilyticus]|uniref:hypothetical protein n=1 Tax=Alkalihalobacterium alkalicellulosilyticum TaxID=1912214 RepID=UPI00099830F5|nr:hypothetical protein [Bacillus alkalicellulosilyticus]
MKILDKFIHDFFIFYDKRNKKGYQVIGLKLTTVFFGIIIFLIITSYLLSVYQKLWLLLPVGFLILWLYKTNKKVDKILLRSIEKKRAEHKDYIAIYLKDELGFNNSIQYKEISLLLKSKGDMETVTYNLTPYLAMILTAIVTTVGLIAKEDQSDVTFLLQLLIFITVILVSTNPIFNVIANLFFNTKPKKVQQISEIIQELYIENLIEENSNKNI